MCPQVAAEVAAPLSQTKKITMVASGEGEVGAGRLTGEVLDIMTRVPDMVNKMTGVDITNKMTNLSTVSESCDHPGPIRAQ